MTANHPLLLVDDDEADVFIMKQALSHAGIENPLLVVETGEEALDYLSGTGQFGDRQRHPLPALVFLDLKLPLLSGFDVLTWIRQTAELAATVVVVLTSSEDQEDLKRAHRLGANSYLVKPSAAGELADQLVETARAFNRDWLAGRSQRHDTSDMK